MKTTRHTPGPWYLNSDGDVISEKTGMEINGTDCGQYLVAVTRQPENSSHPKVFPDYDVDKANARLIAAAPDLLEGAKRILASVAARTDGDFASELEQLEQAILKAEGRGENNE